jgi:hypothetical protein
MAAVWRWRATRLDPVAGAACLATLAFLLTQLTSNSLNVYVDQQFFFWTLAGLLLARLSMRHESGEQALVTGQAGGHG